MNITILILSSIICLSMSGLLNAALTLTLNACGLSDATSNTLAGAANIFIGFEAFVDFALVCLIH